MPDCRDRIATTWFSKTTTPHQYDGIFLMIWFPYLGLEVALFPFSVISVVHLAGDWTR